MMWNLLLMKSVVILGAALLGVHIFPAYCQTVLEAPEKGTVRMPCSVPLHQPEDSVVFIFWYKNADVTSLYTLDARGTTLEEATHKKNETYSHRTTFHVTSDPPYLQIDFLQEDDTGMYYCRVDYQWSSTFITQLKLIVVVPPRKLIIKDDTGSYIEEHAGPYRENQDVFLTCEAQGGFPVPNVTWWRGSELLDSSSQQYAERVVNDVEVEDLKRADLFSTLQCKAENSQVSPAITKTIHLDITLPPLTASIVTPFVSLSSGQTFDIKCESLGSWPAAKITWWLNHTSLPDSTETVQDNMTVGVLHFQPQPSYHQLPLVCQAINPMLPNTSVEDSRRLNITYVPQVSLKLTNEDPQKVPIEGKYLRLWCNVDANPHMLTLGWVFEGMPITHNQSSEVLMSGNALVFKTLLREHRGRYNCFAINSEGKGMSEDYILKIKHAPVCKLGQRITYSIGLKHMVTVRCEVESNPPNVTFRWAFSNAYARHYNFSHSHKGLVSYASYVPSDISDYGTLYCWATNSIGEQLSACFFTVVAPAHPSPSVDCKNNNTSDGSGRFGSMTWFIASSIGLSLLFTAILCSYYAYRSYRKKANLRMEQIINEDMRMYGLQRHPEGRPTRILISKR